MPNSMSKDELSEQTRGLVEKVIVAFNEDYSCSPTHAACAPGRVNLIGEHTDYNDGFVLPMAIPNVTVAVGKANSSAEIRVTTLETGVDPPSKVTFSAPGSSNLAPGKPAWANYIKGVIAHYPGTMTGFDMTVATNVPLGGGLSSSASLEVCTFTLLEALFPCAVSDKDKALVCQKAEHTFAGMPCGIMDQFISTMAGKDYALLIDCMTMESKKVRLQLSDKSILIINSNVKHKLTGSEYPTRRQNCADAAAALAVKSLRFANMQGLEEMKSSMDDVIYRRARHVISEIARTEEAVIALENGDFKKFGQLMVASHKSLRDDFEVSCPELDQLVEIAMLVDGVYGSRMTGGGFGGCTVTLCDTAAVDKVTDLVNRQYQGSASLMVCEASDGAMVIHL